MIFRSLSNTCSHCRQPGTGDELCPIVFTASVLTSHLPYYSHLMDCEELGRQGAIVFPLGQHNLTTDQGDMNARRLLEQWRTGAGQVVNDRGTRGAVLGGQG